MSNAKNYLINGSFEQTISPLDRGFAYGDGVFRTLKIKDGLPEYWPQHYQKLFADCTAIQLVCPSAELLMHDMQQLFLPDESAVAKIIITRGVGDRGYAPPAVTAPMRVMLKTKLPTYDARYFSEGINLHVCNTKCTQQALLAGVKHLNRLENVLARMEWNDPDFFDGVMSDHHKNIIACTSANIFARFNNTLLTPDLTHCGIHGVTRQRILNTAHLLGLKPIVKSFSMAKLLTADDVIICNSLIGAMQVKQLSTQHWAPSQFAESVRQVISA